MGKPLGTPGRPLASASLGRPSGHPRAVDAPIACGRFLLGSCWVGAATLRLDSARLAMPSSRPSALAAQPTRIPALPEETVEIGLLGPGLAGLYGQPLIQGRFRDAS
jgi:hypothetical protein